MKVYLQFISQMKMTTYPAWPPADGPAYPYSETKHENIKQA